MAQEFKVSRGTLREALAELKRRNYIATQSGVGSIVTFDGVVLDQRNGWAQALADSGALVNTEVLRLEAVTRPDLLSRFGTDQFITLDRRRRSNDGTLVSLERSLMPATGGLESLPRVGLIDNSLTITLAAYGYIGERGDQWIGAEPLNAEDAELLGPPGRYGIPESLAHHIRPAKPFHGTGRKFARPGAFSSSPAIWNPAMTALNRALGAFYGWPWVMRWACRPNP